MRDRVGKGVVRRVRIRVRQLYGIQEMGKAMIVRSDGTQFGVLSGDGVENISSSKVKYMASRI